MSRPCHVLKMKMRPCRVKAVAQCFSGSPGEVCVITAAGKLGLSPSWRPFAACCPLSAWFYQFWLITVLSWSLKAQSFSSVSLASPRTSIVTPHHTVRLNRLTADRFLFFVFFPLSVSAVTVTHNDSEQTANGRVDSCSANA